MYHQAICPDRLDDHPDNLEFGVRYLRTPPIERPERYEMTSGSGPGYTLNAYRNYPQDSGVDAQRVLAKQDLDATTRQHRAAASTDFLQNHHQPYFDKVLKVYLENK